MRLYNTLSKKLETFKPIDNKVVRMYHCGPTVYNYAHIGNLRAYVFADTLKRALEYLGYKTKQVINITDVGHLTSNMDHGQDKIEEEARQEQKTAVEIVDFYTRAFFADIQKLNLNISGTLFPKATDHIGEQIALIGALEKKNATYITSDGVYFDTSYYKKYGKLGQVALAGLEEGARITKNLEKKNPTDFALWKFSSPDEKRQQEWPSPWGVGFPGWHIECSAMSMKYLGETFDIHTGGVDHVPVHHNNEIAQSESATGKPYVHFWLHNEFVNIPDGKMSKSKENFIRLATLEENKIHPLAYRYWLLTAHYRSPILFSFEAVRAAQNALESLVRKIGSVEKAGSGAKNDGNAKIKDKDISKITQIKKNLTVAIENDLDTPACIALLHKTADEIASGDIGPEIICDFDAVLGLRLNDLARYTGDIPEKIKNLSREREIFRLSNEWEKADAIRRETENMGYYIDDTQEGPRIHRPLSTLFEN
ncbi:MAG: cysteine--tRNA ligase [Patescibacteria group bacterium]